MKRLFSKLALVFAITLMASMTTSCSSNDDDNKVDNTYTKEYTFYVTTDQITLDAGAPFTKDQLAKQYNDAINKACDGTWLDYDTLLKVALDVYNTQALADQTKYIHGTTTIMCHVKSTNKEMYLYSYNVDTAMLKEIEGD